MHKLHTPAILHYSQEYPLVLVICLLQCRLIGTHKLKHFYYFTMATETLATCTCQMNARISGKSTVVEVI